MSPSYSIWQERTLPVVVMVLFYILTFPPVALLQPARPMTGSTGAGTGTAITWDWFRSYRTPYLWLRSTSLDTPLKAYEKWWQHLLGA